MKLVMVRYFFNEKKGIFYYTADGRIDFRQLVKDLAKEFKMRIEMRQVGVRDEAKMVGGLGVCGRSLCCFSFMKSFEPVTIQKAKKQQIVINPTKISGLCGRLMCALPSKTKAAAVCMLKKRKWKRIEAVFFSLTPLIFSVLLCKSDYAVLRQLSLTEDSYY